MAFFVAFLGSEESILEYEAERPAIANVTAVSIHSEVRSPNDALLRSRDFVIDFPRVFVLEAGSTTTTGRDLFTSRVPDRSQSSLSLANSKDWMSLVTNKLDDQNGLRRARKSVRYEMQENLLGIRAEPSKKRRSHSADGRYSTGLFGRRELLALRGHRSNAPSGTSNENPKTARRFSDAIRVLTDATYGQSKQRQKEELLLDTRPSTSNAGGARRRSIHRDSEIPIDLVQRNSVASDCSYDSKTARSVSPVPISIQINGEGIDLE